jgi:tetratricopeptide (TPR) repeat protein
MASIGRARYRIVWSIAAVAILAGIGVAMYRWWAPLERTLTGFLRPTSSRLATAAAAYEQGDWERAVDLSRQLLKTRKDDPEVRRLYARASVRLERDRTAGAIYDRLGAGWLETEDSFLLGLTFVRAGNPTGAIETWTKATQSGRDHPEMLDHLARLSAGMRRLDEAAQAARKLARQPGWEAHGFLLLGEVQGLLANPKGAVDAMRQGLGFDPTAKGLPFGLDHYRKLLARSSMEIGQPNQAIEALLSGPGTPGVSIADLESNWLLSRAFLQSGRTADALAALKRAGPYRDENPLVPEPSLYVGASQCASCHAKETRSHARSRHARTLHRGRGLLELPFPDHPLADPDLPRVTHTFKRDQNSIQVETHSGDRVFETIIEYAFGVRERYVTMIGRDAERNYRALRLSSYHTGDGVGWGRTAGDVPESDSLENVRGEQVPVRDGVVRCVYCHVTNFRDFRDPPPETGLSPAAADTGIGCERCHGPGGNHLMAIKASFPDRAIVNTGGASSTAIVAQCADCHTVGTSSEIKRAPDHPDFVRSAGLTLTFSRCYTESGGGLSCLTCHDPHRDDEGPAAVYETKCLACHSRQSDSQTVCRVNKANECLKCHMPKVPVAVLHTALTDHYIRVHKKEDEHDRSRGIDQDVPRGPEEGRSARRLERSISP